jgi:hypothetical protein
LLLAACGPLLIRDEAARGYVPLRDASLELHRDVVVPPERARVFFQQGVVQPGINEYRPHCELTIRNLADRPQTIHADHFTVERVSADIVHVVTSGDVVVAVNVEFQLTSGGGGGAFPCLRRGLQPSGAGIETQPPGYRHRPRRQCDA